MDTLPAELDQKYRALQETFRKLGSVAVAYSGGIDSTLVLKVAYDCLGDRAVGVTAVSPSVAKAELEEAQGIAREIGVRHELVESHEMADPGYVENSPNRCYFCKTNAYQEIFALAEQLGIRHVADGTNADDVDDHRPGRKAAKEKGVVSPLQQNGITKSEIRLLARYLGLPNWDKPAAACLSSRIPYGTPVSEQALKQVELAEAYLKELGFRQLRVRHHEVLARIEVEPEDFSRLLSLREKVVERFQQIGYKFVTLDLKGFRSGSMNELLTTETWTQKN